MKTGLRNPKSLWLWVLVEDSLSQRFAAEVTTEELSMAKASAGMMSAAGAQGDHRKKDWRNRGSLAKWEE